MPIPEHYAIIQKGVEEWNKWRETYPHIRPDLSGVELTPLKYNGINLSFINLQGAILAGSDLTDLELNKADFSKSYLNGTNLFKAKLRCSNFRSANLYDVKMECADFRSANFECSTLKNIQCNNETKFMGAIFIKADLTAADFAEVKFYGANFSKAKLVETNFTYANLSGAIMRKADMKNAVLYQSNLKDTDLSYANLKGVNLSNARNIKHIIIEGGYDFSIEPSSLNKEKNFDNIENPNIRVSMHEPRKVYKRNIINITTNKGDVILGQDNANVIKQG